MVAVEKYLTVLVVSLCMLLIQVPTISADSDDADQELETFTLDEPLGRTFITVNGSNIVTTPNFVVGITLIGISLALLFGSAASAASVAAASTLAAGAPLGKYKRSIEDNESNFDTDSLFKSFSTLEDQFKNFDVTDVECRKRIICEIHQESEAVNKRLGNFTNYVLDTFNTLSSDEDKKKYPLLKQYLEAANHGKSQKQCSQVYNSCEYSVKNVLRNLTF